MSAFERLLVPGCTELLDCRCGEVMQIARIERFAERATRQFASTNALLASMKCGLLFGLPI
jgi:hypothetical protein